MEKYFSFCIKWRKKKIHTQKKYSSSKVNFIPKSDNTSFDFTLVAKEKELTEYLNDLLLNFMKIKFNLKNFRKLDEHFLEFKTPKRFMEAITIYI